MMRTFGLDFSDYIADRAHDFVGREWVFAEIDTWLTDPNAPRFFVITGEPGIGKTAIAARLTQIRDLDAYHFCIARDATTIDPLNFAHSISHQLTRIDDFAINLLEEQGVQVNAHLNVHQNYGQAINVNIERLIGLDQQRATTAFNHIVVNPLKLLYADGFDRQLVILVDALDEAAQLRGMESIVDLLANARGLPPKVRFVLTSRPEGEVLRHFDNLHIPHLVLDAGGKENQQDVRAYVRHRMATSAKSRARLSKQAMSDDAFVARVTGASKGNFLYVQWLLRGIDEGTQRFDTLDALPEGLDDIYREFLRTRQVGEDIRVWREHYRPLLGVLATAQCPLTKEQLVAFTKLDKQTVKDVLDDVQQFLDPIGAGENQYRLYHQSMVDFLGDEALADEFWIDLNSIHIKIVQYHTDLYYGHWEKMDYYGTQNLLMHMLLGNPKWAEVRRGRLDEYGKKYLFMHIIRVDRSEYIDKLVKEWKDSL